MTQYRTAARLILLNSANNVLLLRHTIGYEEPYWATPGGGLEPGETAEQAARREAKEELGTEWVELQSLWTGEARYTYKGQQVIQSETFFWATQYSEILGSGMEAAHQQEGITESRWWSVEALKSTDELVFPTDLVAQLKALCL